MIQFDEHIFQMGWNHRLEKDGFITIYTKKTDMTMEPQPVLKMYFLLFKWGFSILSC